MRRFKFVGVHDALMHRRSKTSWRKTLQMKVKGCHARSATKGPAPWSENCISLSKSHRMKDTQLLEKRVDDESHKPFRVLVKYTRFNTEKT